MSPPSRPRRSLLYMPASNARALEKAQGLPADGLIFDLEDAVAPAAKVEARSGAVAAARSGRYGSREIFIRVNGLDTSWAADDLRAAASSAADALLLPKANSADDVRRAIALLADAGAPASQLLWAMMETPRGILAAAELARVNESLPTPRFGGFVVGTADLAKDLHCAHPADRWTMSFALQQCVMAARAHDLGVIDGVFFDLNDEDGFARSCRQGRELGFDGKTLIHPKQIAVANATFAPLPADIAHARRVIAAHAQARAQGQGVTLLDGKLVEILHVAEAERLLAQAEAIARLEAGHAPAA